LTNLVGGVGLGVTFY